ncbi:hypothetical protein LOK74_17795 [Brevibacillus humidisoli]|uniref:hypothetical protein n=1 Tax=Brevibacillus humidisoli TaxID=2895522 RepID=UPI001E3D2463|nr:hypothetical protein [Brevibacillus humidisoli]UFJ39886.1 hypothetical protein LOK74_17795 [Brevibacillus humidisoli]
MSFRLSPIRLFALACLFCLSWIVQGVVGAEPQQPEFEVGQTLRVPGLPLPDDTKIVQVKRADVTGDRTEDTVLLVGQTLPDNPSFYSQLNVVVRDGKTGKYSALPQRQIKNYLSGYQPSLFLGDFTGDKASDVMVTVATGGSGGTSNHLIASWRNNNPVVIFGEQQNQGLRIKGKYLDGFKAELHSEVLNKTFIVDVSGYKQQYIEAGIYDRNGKYIYESPRNGQQSEYDIFSDPFYSLVPVDTDNDGVYELQGKQNIWGPIHVFTFATVNSTWDYKNGKWNIPDASYTLTYSITNGG